MFVGPALLRSEALSAIHESLWRRQIDLALAVEMRERVLDLPVEIVDDRVAYVEAWTVAERFGLAKTYDAMYVGLAKRRNLPLLTVDGRLRRTVGDYVQVLGLADL